MEQRVYTTKQVASLTGLSVRQLDYWAQRGIVSPSVQQSHGPGTRKVYSFDDLVQLRFISQVKRLGCSTQKLRKAIEILRAIIDDPNPLKNAVLMNGQNTILALCKTREGERVLLDALSVTGQQVMSIVLELLIKEVVADIMLDEVSYE